MQHLGYTHRKFLRDTLQRIAGNTAFAANMDPGDPRLARNLQLVINDVARLAEYAGLPAPGTEGGVPRSPVTPRGLAIEDFDPERHVRARRADDRRTAPAPAGVVTTEGL